MRPTTRTVENSEHLAALFHFLGDMPHPFTVTVSKGKKRSLDQNALCWKWAGEIAAHLGDQTANEIHAYNKLHFGVPILREHDEEFREAYDEQIKPLTYEAKLAIMAPPLDLPVTRRMKTGAMTQYLDTLVAYWRSQGVILTIPEEG